MSKAWHYDACIEVWNEIAEILEDGESSTQEIKKKSKVALKYKPESYCFACEFYNKCSDGCPFMIQYGKVCVYSMPYFIFEYGEGTRQDAIEIAQLFIDYYPETDEELTYRDF